LRAVDALPPIHSRSNDVVTNQKMEGVMPAGMMCIPPVGWVLQKILSPNKKSVGRNSKLISTRRRKNPVVPVVDQRKVLENPHPAVHLGYACEPAMIK